MKSALELAMERADEALGDEKVELTDEQKQAISEVRKVYEAKWAEQEIVLKQRIAKAQAETDPQTFAEHRRQFQDEMNQVRDGIFAERDDGLVLLPLVRTDVDGRVVADLLFVSRPRCRRGRSR